MASVKELTARFDRREDPDHIAVPHESNRPEIITCSGAGSGTQNDPSAYYRTYRTASHSELVEPVNKLSQPSHSMGLNLEMLPMSLASRSPNGGAAQKLGTHDALHPTGSMIEPIPASQPARFLHRSKPTPSLLSDPSGQDVPGVSEGNYHASELSNAPTINPLASFQESCDSPPLDLGLAELHHTPLPVTQLFSRDAALLYLPELDDALEKLPRFDFTHVRDSSSLPRMFSPMNLLRGRRLKDLVRNDLPTPIWRDWNSIGSTLVNLALSIMGSSAISTFYSLAGLYNAVQIFALILNTIAGHNSGQWRALLLGTIPNILALNFGGKLLQSITFLSILTILSVILLAWFYRLTNRWMPDVAPEGLLTRSLSRGTKAVPFVSLVLTVLYLPLSTISVHAIIWSSDFWPVDNPYLNLDSTQQPDLSPLGPSSIYRDPLDFCWTTTMRRDEVNFAPGAVILGVFTLALMTIWFPIRLANTIKRCLPTVEPFDGLGQPRSAQELEREYQRRLERDKSPFNFLYNEYRRNWGSYKALYLGAKLTALLIVALMSPDTCLALSLAKYHSISRTMLSGARQSVLVVAMTGFLILQSIAAPFVDPVSNASEWTSRMNFVLTSVLGLLVALDIPGQHFWNGWALYIVYIVTYGLAIYFTVVNWNWMHRVIKRIARRIDFSIDIFSPRLDISPDSKHLKQRIWQESITTLLLVAPQCQIPATQKMMFTEGVEVDSKNSTPPYLLDFAGSPAERHIENLKILREIGHNSYELPSTKSLDEKQRTTELRHKILRRLIGPDAFWCPPGSRSTAASCFGNAWCIPFPLTVVVRYDVGSALVALNTLDELEEFVRQNESPRVEKQKEMRIALRCLDNTIVKWPYTHTELLGNRFRWVGGRRYNAQRSTDYYHATLIVRRNGIFYWEGVNLASGFDVALHYARDIILDASPIGLNAELELTPQLARFLLLNKSTLQAGISEYSRLLGSYRAHAHREATAKAMTLSYEFISNVYNTPASPEVISHVLAEHEPNIRVRDLAVGYGDVFLATDERMRCVSQSSVSAWWFLFWNDFWRRNKATIKSMTTHSPDFDPQYSTSIAYSPLPRPALESFLKQRGMWSPRIRWYGNWHWFHTGLINKIYFHLNWIIFHGSSKTLHVHLGDGPSALDLLDVDVQSRVASPRPKNTDDEIGVTTSSGIKAGTDHSDSIMRTRRAYRWETLLSEHPGGRSMAKKQDYWVSWRGRMSQWFGLSPFGRMHWYTGGVVVDVVSEHDGSEEARYVRLYTHRE
ncbi:hypothetical protein BDV93DRAFT_501109 [Ceratobasidium sp. AG-I]|nr:hypothetical protein BDV93DRAFT_501109 [Ceratobasidium sp. AG-I]